MTKLSLQYQQAIVVVLNRVNIVVDVYIMLWVAQSEVGDYSNTIIILCIQWSHAHCYTLDLLCWIVSLKYMHSNK